MLLRMIWLGIFLGLGMPTALPHDPAEMPERYAVRAGWIYTLSDTPGVPALIQNGVMVIENGRILKIGADLELPERIPIIDYTDEVIMPGLVAAGLDLVPSLGGRESVSAKYRALDGFDMFSDYKALLAGGVTSAHLNPGRHRFVSGQGAVVKLAGDDHAHRVLINGNDLCITLGPAAFNAPALQEYPLPASSAHEIPVSTPQRPGSRLAQFAELRKVFDSLGAPDNEDKDEFDYNRQVLRAALAASPVLRIDARRVDDIRGAIRFLKERKLRGYIIGAVEAHKAVDGLKAAGFPVVLEMPLTLARPAADLGFREDLLDGRLETPACLAKAKVPFALTLPNRERGSDLMLAAAAAVRGGLDPMKALEAVTRAPAEILGVADRVGSLTPGRDADFIVLNGRPLMNRTHVNKVFVSGREVFSHPKAKSAVVIRAGRILTNAGPAIIDGEILIEDGKITAVGHDVPLPPGARCFDAGPDAVVTPGFIDGHSYLGLEGDRSKVSTDVCPADAIVVPGRNFDRVANAGVTTVILATQGASTKPTQLSAIKTAGNNRSELVLRDLVGLKFGFRNQDPLLGAKSLDAAIQAGKRYDDSWKKYYDDLKKWEEEKAKKEAAAEEAKEEEKKAEKDEAAKEGEAEKEGDSPEGKNGKDKKNGDKEEDEDPITGTWSYEVSGDPLPGPQQGEFKLILDGDRITGTGVIFFTGPEEVAVEGKLLGGKIVQLEIDVETPVGSPKVEAELVEKDKMVGEVKLEPYLNLAYEATRTEKKEPVVTVTAKKKKKDDDGRPQPPKLNESLEPYRPLLAGKIPALVDVDTAASIEKIIKIFVETHKLKLGLLGADHAYKIADSIRKAEASVVLPPGVMTRRDGKTVIPSDELSREGISIVFQSQAEDGARSLPLLAAYAVYNGLNPEEALKALTLHPARLYKIDDRVGTLEKGKDADLVIFGGSPFEISTPILRVFVSGKEVEK